MRSSQLRPATLKKEPLACVQRETPGDTRDQGTQQSNAAPQDHDLSTYTRCLDLSPPAAPPHLTSKGDCPPPTGPLKHSYPLSRSGLCGKPKEEFQGLEDGSTQLVSFIYGLSECHEPGDGWKSPHIYNRPSHHTREGLAWINTSFSLHSQLFLHFLCSFCLGALRFSVVARLSKVRARPGLYMFRRLPENILGLAKFHPTG